ncbi:MAG: RsmB/NOP family class I SAM-dependent RNA methyltransferase [Alphaproteobacteria bacterium]|nr:RsmB/NOP family class I SAM-dependent RNA methyltransferase [Alphaproteobacteria bacterium]MCL2505149.1 RsmB/NOP family class I SAM-dependent RNA methyltransferase [Alphaproteobacteria bacterium]
MKPSARIQAAIELLLEIEDSAYPMDSVVQKYFRARRFIGSNDRTDISNRVYSILRNKAKLGWQLERNYCQVTARNYVLGWLLLGEGKSKTEIDELFDGEKFSPERITKEENEIVDSLTAHTLEHPHMPEEITTECPKSCYASLKAKFNDRFQEEMLAMQGPAPLDIRVNTVKTNREKVLSFLHENNIKAEPCKLSPYGIRINQKVNLNNLKPLKDGSIEVQDEGSQLIAMLVKPAPSDRVIDFCAGAGGKTLALAAMMNNKGKIYACDTNATRLKKGAERFRKAGFHNIETKVLTSGHDEWIKKHEKSFDKVLVDAPCSGTGTWRRNPDSRWKPLGLEKLVQQQYNILSSASRLVKNKGQLVYATCSLLKEENEQQINRFLKEHKDFEPIPCGIKGEPYLSLSPAQNNTDGFFAAVLEKSARNSGI